jgi:uncharacterized protein YfbU (UPF0304 family)
MSNLDKLLLLQAKVCAKTEPELYEYVNVLIEIEGQYDEYDKYSDFIDIVK